MALPYAPSRRDVKKNLGYVIVRLVGQYKRDLVSRCRRYILATYTRSQPTVFATVMRTYLACWQGNFGLEGRLVLQAADEVAGGREELAALGADSFRHGDADLPRVLAGELQAKGEVIARAMQCPVCQSEHVGDARVCSACGVPLGVPWDVERIRAQLKRWQERLLDLTKASPLLGINRSRVSNL